MTMLPGVRENGCRLNNVEQVLRHILGRGLVLAIPDLGETVGQPGEEHEVIEASGTA